MKEEKFQELLQSVEEMGQIMRGEIKPARVSKMMIRVPVKDVRDKLGFTQKELSHLLGIGIKTIRNWEQGRRVPGKASRILIEIASRYPDIVREVSQRVSEEETSQRRSTSRGSPR